MKSTSLLSTRALDVSIAGKQVCRGLDLELSAGTCLGVLGANGVGKTTLLHTLAGLRATDNGEILLAGEDITALSRRRIARQLGLLIQQQEDSLPASVLETALIGRHPHIDFWRWESHTDVAIARRTLKLTGLDGLEQRSQTQLSGGERRRLAIATILAQDPAVFLLDEPTHQLDLQHQITLLGLFAKLAHQQDRLVVISLHDVNLAARFCSHVMLLFGAGEIMVGPTREILTAANLTRLYRIPVLPVTWPGGTLFVPEREPRT
ncbi:MAG TPA: ABC transporter ATP-binding protein [Gammaproteobacteria bacterium]|nr:ABC transporter ATP-binding protein [Gammaproteobacteria bacterium]